MPLPTMGLRHISVLSEPEIVTAVRVLTNTECGLVWVTAPLTRRSEHCTESKP